MHLSGGTDETRIVHAAFIAITCLVMLQDGGAPAAEDELDQLGGSLTGLAAASTIGFGGVLRATGLSSIG